MLRFKLTIAYDGTRYFGWQVQKGRMTVQQRVEEALRELFPSVKRVHSCSRTDTGVHAMGMVAHVDIPKAECRMDARKLLLAVNSFLPVDVRIVVTRRVPEEFHARFDAKGKRYFYLIWNHAAMNPLLHNRAWHVKVPLNLERMQKAAKLFVGRKDFKSFASTREYEMESTVRRLTRCDVRKEGYTWKITFLLKCKLIKTARNYSNELGLGCNLALIKSTQKHQENVPNPHF